MGKLFSASSLIQGKGKKKLTRLFWSLRQTEKIWKEKKANRTLKI
jgi:hypothetical protein